MTESLYQHHVEYAERVLANARRRDTTRGPFFDEGKTDAQIAADHLFGCGAMQFVAPGEPIHPEGMNVAVLALLIDRVRRDERVRCGKRLHEVAALHRGNDGEKSVAIAADMLVDVDPSPSEGDPE